MPTGGFAIFPTGLLAATAGASGMKPARYFAAAAGLVVGAGYGLGLAQRESDLRLTVIGTAGADRAVRPAEVVCPARAETALLANPGRPVSLILSLIHVRVPASITGYHRALSRA
jgi:hypothetical protein